MSVENPGSFNDWSQCHSEVATDARLFEYGSALGSYRQELAAERHISEEELHSQRFTDIVSFSGGLVVEHESKKNAQVA
ncbi:MAG: hypothetical protein ACREF7_02205 [Candidatus Saccharimonadales bacterium]